MAYEHLRMLWKKQDPQLTGWLRRSAVSWRKEPVITRVFRPTRPEKARQLGYKAKQGIIVVRVRIRTGGARKPRPRSGRRQKALGVAKFTRSISIQDIAQNRVGRKYPNMRVRDSYHVYSDGRNHWYEVILIDQNHPANKA